MHVPCRLSLKNQRRQFKVARLLMFPIHVWCLPDAVKRKSPGFCVAMDSYFLHHQTLLCPPCEIRPYRLIPDFYATLFIFYSVNTCYLEAIRKVMQT